MFGLIVAGRLVQTDFQAVGERQFLMNIPEADSINHVVVFMTGQTPFPDDLGGAVHFSWPRDDGGPSCWQLLGHISNHKPSAIFKIAKLKNNEQSSNSLLFGTQQQHMSHLAQIGISVEPLVELAQQTPAQGTTVSGVDTFVAFSQKMLGNFMNYASSFAVSPQQLVSGGATSDTYVPISALHKWYGNFERRLQQNPYFWKS